MPSSKPSLARRLAPATAAIALLLALVAVPQARLHLRAAGLLLRFANPDDASAVARFGVAAVDESGVRLGPDGRVAARLYRPRGERSPPGIVLVHGVHHLGIEEPRLVRFARAFAQAGFAVLTPRVEELADYRIDPASVETIGLAIESLRTLLPDSGPVGLIGLSFAGGLGLLAAANPRWAREVRFVLAVGAHADLARVLAFFATNEIALPDGGRARLAAHDYGPIVLVYSHPELFFAPAEIEEARRVLRLWLTDRHDEARRAAKALDEPLRGHVSPFLTRETATLGPRLQAALPALAGETGAVSPAGRLAGLRAPVFLLHGAGDTVIPASEARWLALEVPARRLAAALVSPALVHVALGEVSAGDRWALVRFMARVLAAGEG